MGFPPRSPDPKIDSTCSVYCTHVLYITKKYTYKYIYIYRYLKKKNTQNIRIYVGISLRRMAEICILLRLPMVAPMGFQCSHHIDLWFHPRFLQMLASLMVLVLEEGSGCQKMPKIHRCCETLGHWSPDSAPLTVTGYGSIPIDTVC